MSGNSSVGQASVYEAGDQRNYKDSEINKSDPYNEGQANSHKNLDSSTWRLQWPDLSSRSITDQLTEDERSIANKLAAEEVCHLDSIWMQSTC
jgi:hypothetical protein